MSSILEINHAEDIKSLAWIHEKSLKPAWSESAFSSTLQDPTVRGWKTINDQEEIVGFILARLLFDEAEILTFAINPDSQRQGLGHKLLTHLISYCKSNDIIKVFLEVNENNIAAISLYKQHNFITIDLRRNYYQTAPNHWDNALIMQNNLNAEIIDKSVKF